MYFHKRRVWWGIIGGGIGGKHVEDPLQVIKKFNYSQFARNTLYYELAYHDYTQKPACPNPTCITSQLDK